MCVHPASQGSLGVGTGMGGDGGWDLRGVDVLHWMCG